MESRMLDRLSYQNADAEGAGGLIARNRSLVVLPAPAGRQPASDCVEVIQFDDGCDGRDRPIEGPSMSTAPNAEILESADCDIRRADLVRVGNMAYRSVGGLANGFIQTIDLVA